MCRLAALYSFCGACLSRTYKIDLSPPTPTHPLTNDRFRLGVGRQAKDFQVYRSRSESGPNRPVLKTLDFSKKMNLQVQYRSEDLSPNLGASLTDNHCQRDTKQPIGTSQRVPRGTKSRPKSPCLRTLVLGENSIRASTGSCFVKNDKGWGRFYIPTLATVRLSRRWGTRTVEAREAGLPPCEG